MCYRFVGTKKGRLDDLEGDGGHVPGGGQVEEGEHGGEAILPGSAVAGRLRHHVLVRGRLGAVGGGNPVGRHDAHLSNHPTRLILCNSSASALKSKDPRSTLHSALWLRLFSLILFLHAATARLVNLVYFRFIRVARQSNFCLFDDGIAKDFLVAKWT